MKIFITGGAGFIGINCADHFLKQGQQVVLYDNLSRTGAQANLEWLQERQGDNFDFVHRDVRDYDSLATAIVGADAVLHLASQVAVTSSVEDPRHDFEVNALGTFNVLEAVRNYCPQAALIYASTNKVYGSLDSVRVIEEEKRYRFANFTHGIPENFPLDLHSPYGCSKGAGDQYTIDYARIYGLRTVTLRQSCIYGPRQFGVEDQGWVAHFAISAVLGRPVVVYGNGKQVRDLLHISDLVRAYERAIDQAGELAGVALNIGGGPDNTLAVWSEFGPLLESLVERPLEVRFEGWRPGDQRIFVADIRRATAKLGWRPRVSVGEGIRQLVGWVQDNRDLFDE